MFALIVYIVMTQSIQVIQIDGFSSKTKCEEAFVNMMPAYDTYLKSNNGSMMSYCIDKGKDLKHTIKTE